MGLRAVEVSPSPKCHVQDAAPLVWFERRTVSPLTLTSKSTVGGFGVGVASGTGVGVGAGVGGGVGAGVGGGVGAGVGRGGGGGVARGVGAWVGGGVGADVGPGVGAGPLVGSCVGGPDGSRVERGAPVVDYGNAGR